MKNNQEYDNSIMNKMVKIIVGTLLAMLVMSNDLIAQSDPLNVSITLSYYNNADATKTLKGKVGTRIDRKFTYVQGVSLNFYTVRDTIKSFLDKAETDEKGLAKINLPADFNFPTDSISNGITFLVEFEGNTEFNNAASEITMKDVLVNVELSEEDSVKIISATTSGIDGTQIADMEIGCGVTRMYYPLSIGTEYTDEEGMVSFIFPDDLPADIDGGVSILIKIVDNEEYGNVEIKKTINWGLQNVDEEHNAKRALWGSLAPLWMIITLIVLMTGVYSQFAVIVYKLIKIKREKN